MAGLDGPVCLTHSAPFAVHSHQLVFYDVIDLTASSRCGVLSNIAEAGGDARLPSSVTVSDFKKWITAVEDSKAIVKQRPFSYLCVVLKVADSLDDKHVDEWTSLVAESLLEHALAEESESCIQEIEQGLARLPQNLQHRLLAVAACDPSRLCSLLDFLPACHHAALLAATITPDKMLQAPIRRNTLSIFNALASLPASPASILSLHAHDHGAWSYRTHQTGWLEIAEHLAQALQHHSHLTTLILSTPEADAAAAKLLFPAIDTLTSLQSLHLGSEERAFPAESMAILQQSLRCLPHLQSLTMMLKVGAPPLVLGSKRPLDADALPATVCLAAALSPATGLTSLHLHLPTSGHRFTVTAPLSLPHLQQLTAVLVDDRHLTSAFLSHLAAPLTSLEVDNRNRGVRPGSFHLPINSNVDAQTFLGSLAKLRTLRRVCVLLPADRGSERTVFDEMMSTAPAVLACLQHLQELSIAARSPVLHRVVPLLAAGLTALSHLHLSFWKSRFESESAIPWPEFFDHLCQFSLQHLDIDGGNDVHHLAGGLGVARLVGLKQLSCLRIKGWQCLATAADCEALAGMTCLRSLSLNNCIPGRPRSASSCDAATCALLLTMTALTSLSLTDNSAQFGRMVVERLAAHPPQAAWPALQELSLDVSAPFSTAKQVFCHAASLPALKRLTLAMHWEGDSDDDDRDKQIRDEMSCLDTTLNCLATDAGLQLSLRWIEEIPELCSGLAHYGL